MSAPTFTPASVPTRRRYTVEDMAEFEARLKAVEDFCALVNDYLHEEPDDDESPAEAKLRDLLTRVLERAAEAKLLKGGK